MEADAKLLLDEPSQACPRPKFAAKAVLAGGIMEPASDNLLLRRRELGRAACHRLGRQRAWSLTTKSGPPAAHRRSI